ncbi:hypothetical protein BD311DRAFT_749133 [Dichomitus squalens]|uniref:Uncharacterized protein n=1 Tax=Dichomitus squalens TaxID=114155 RepID=A0A4Q9MZY5_9APHY|nr:hypothetical protein BD311DRAFT_749133 [Dichomitus squalens]
MEICHNQRVRIGHPNMLCNVPFVGIATPRKPSPHTSRFLSRQCWAPACFSHSTDSHSPGVRLWVGIGVIKECLVPELRPLRCTPPCTGHDFLVPGNSRSLRLRRRSFDSNIYVFPPIAFMIHACPTKPPLDLHLPCVQCNDAEKRHTIYCVPGRGAEGRA